MSTWLICLCGCIYLYVAAEQLWLGSWPTALLYLGYAIADIGAVFVIYKGVSH